MSYISPIFSKYFFLTFNSFLSRYTYLWWLYFVLIFAGLSWSLHDLTWLLSILKGIHYLFYWRNLLLFFWFLPSHDNLYIVHRIWNLFYHIYTIITKHNQTWKDYFHWHFQCNLLTIKKRYKNFLYNFITFVIFHYIYFI